MEDNNINPIDFRNDKEIVNILSNLKHRIFPRPFEREAVKGENLLGAEIGVYKGEHAESLLRRLPIGKLFLVDPYEMYPDYYDGKLHYGVDQTPLDIAEKEAKQRLKQFEDKIVWIRKTSRNAISDLPQKLDFVYIDSNHQYEYIWSELRDYYARVKEGGILGGHDMYNGFQKEHTGVITAVLNFVQKNNLQLCVELPDWWVVKGKEAAAYDFQEKREVPLDHYINLHSSPIA